MARYNKPLNLQRSQFETRLWKDSFKHAASTHAQISTINSVPCEEWRILTGAKHLPNFPFSSFPATTLSTRTEQYGSGAKRGKFESKLDRSSFYSTAEFFSWCLKAWKQIYLQNSPQRRCLCMRISACLYFLYTSVCKWDNMSKAVFKLDEWTRRDVMKKSLLGSLLCLPLLSIFGRIIFK